MSGPTAILLGALADAALGDPRRGHPVAGIGTLAARLEARAWADDSVRGARHAALLAAAVALPVAAAARTREPVATLAGAAVLWAALGGRSLAAAGTRMADLLDAGDVDGARALAPTLVGRDPASLDAAGLARASTESLAENGPDAVLNPLVWHALLGPTGVAVHRTANTLDAMVGHRTPRHARYGAPAARVDDVLGWPGSRLAVLLTALLAPTVGGETAGTLRVARRDGPAHPSPNGGPAEAAMAGALGVRLGGTTAYTHRVEERPVLGAGPAPAADDVRRAVRLACASSGLAALLAASAAALPRRARGALAALALLAGARATVRAARRDAAATCAPEAGARTLDPARPHPVGAVPPAAPRPGPGAP